MNQNAESRLRSPGLWLRLLCFAAFTIAAAVLLFWHPPWPQNLAYHNFADQRTLLGVPNFWNVASNLPFLVVGTLGVLLVWRRDERARERFVISAERWPYFFFFLGIGLTAFGSSYYHLEPNNDRLVWDRLPMTLAFMGLFSAIIAERLDVRLGLALLGPLLVAGVASVWYWHATDDLRPYYFVQFYPGLAMPLLFLLFPPRYTGTGYLLLALACYVAAKFCEHPLDHWIYERLAGIWSGHTVKHLLAALATYWVYVAIQRRQPCAETSLAVTGRSAPSGHG
jgi:hypothetical protein